MTPTVARDRVKAMCGIADGSADAEIDALIGAHLPAIGYSLRAEVLSSSDSGLAALINLGASEIVAGEFVAQRRRAPGAAESVRFGAFSLGALPGNPRDPSGLIASGRERLRPFLRDEAFVSSVSRVWQSDGMTEGSPEGAL